ncbi:MAG TPA: hypothetical protein PLL09_13370 [Flavobacterium sp.]|uniref:hypothetical protein n=1 Tax=unclassified Flavobacterium TaxID=196869 RepID=UPI0025BB38B3|nr:MULTISPECIES: hypothetical protein [unclassified Flavobacterium]HRE78801.1 hypothetical protein [Flavobacterium sp.]
MKYFIAIVTFFFLFRPIFPVMNYVVNYDYISNELCENKAKPELECNGKCHLKAELANASEESTPASHESKSNITLELLFLETIPEFKFNRIYVEKNQVSISYSRLYFRLHNTSIFHPPTV